MTPAQNSMSVAGVLSAICAIFLVCGIPGWVLKPISILTSAVPVDAEATLLRMTTGNPPKYLVTYQFSVAGVVYTGTDWCEGPPGKTIGAWMVPAQPTINGLNLLGVAKAKLGCFAFMLLIFLPILLLTTRKWYRVCRLERDADPFRRAPRSPRSPPAGAPEQSGKLPEVIQAELWLSHPTEYGRPPDHCTLISRTAMVIPGAGKTLLSLCRYRYNDTGETGRVVASRLKQVTWAFVGPGVDAISDSYYLVAYCGWCSLVSGIEGKSVVAEEVDEEVTVPGHRSARAHERYRIGNSVVHEFKGVDDQGREVVGSTDGSFTVSFAKTDPNSLLPSTYFLLGAALNTPGR
jgi:hypothetical protein